MPSNAVVDMVQAGNLDAAEQAAHDLLARFPDVHDGYDRLGMVCEARGDHRQAADWHCHLMQYRNESAELCVKHAAGSAILGRGASAWTGDNCERGGGRELN